MVKINLKKESKKAQKKRTNMQQSLKNVVEATETQIENWKLLLDFLLKIQKELDILSIETNNNEELIPIFEKKAHAVNTLKTLYNEYYNQTEAEWAERDKWLNLDIEFTESYALVLGYDMINAIDKKSAKVIKMEGKPITEKITDEKIDSLKKQGTWVNDL